MFIAISGLSGAGKTSCGKLLAEKLGFTFIDLDWYFLEQKPIVTLSNGVKVKNYDCYEALDLEKIHAMDTYNVILVGFVLTDRVLPKNQIIIFI